MPPYSNPYALGSQALDDPIVFDICPSFDGGMVSNVRANLLQENQAALLINCEIGRNGEISTRRGSTKLGAGTAGTGTFIQGITYFETPTYNYPVVANGTLLYSYDGANWNNFSAFAATSSANKIGFAQGVDKLYLCELGVGHIYQWDGAALTDICTTDLNTDPPRSPTFIAWHTGRLVVAGGLFAGVEVPDALTFSQYLTAGYSSTSFNWDRNKWSLRVGTGEGDPITGIYPWTDFNLIVFKRHSVWVVNCDPALQLADTTSNTIVGFQTKPIHKRIGCIAPWTAVQVGSDVFFLATDGVRSIKRVVAAETQTETSPAISLPIQDYIDRINKAYVGTSTAIFYNNKYILSVPLDNATSPNYSFVYDTLNQSWTGIWTGWTPTGYAIRNITGEPGRLIFGQNDGNVLEFLSYIQAANETDTHFKDNGVDIPISILTRAMTFGEFLLRKEGLNCEFEFNQSTAQSTCQVAIDASGNQAFEAFTTSGGQTLLPQTLPFTLSTAGVVRSSRDLQRYGLFRELQFYLSTTSQKLVLRSIGASAFHNALELQRN